MTNAPPPPDDPKIADTWPLLRRLHPMWVVSDGQGGLKVSKQAFEDPPVPGGAVSVYVEPILETHGLTGDAVLKGFPGYGLLSLAAASARSLRLGVVMRPDLSDLPRGHAHAEIEGRKTPAIRRELARVSTVRRWPRDDA